MGNIVIEPCIQDKVKRIIEILKTTVDGDCALALAGAHAKGMADKNSDIDIFLFTDKPKSFEERSKVIKKFSDAGTTPWISDTFDNPWGGSMDFSFEGTPVEVVVRLIPQMDKRLNECLNGHFEIIPQTWTSNGYYTFTYLCELSFIIPIWDPNHLIENYQKKIIPYPSKLKKSIIDRFFARANTWINNFHYQSAIKRKDVLFTSPIVIHTVLDIIQIIFALNEEYYTGDKKLEIALDKLSYCPKELLENIEFLLTTSYDTEQLQKQSIILHNIIQNVKLKINECV